MSIKDTIVTDNPASSGEWKAYWDKYKNTLLIFIIILTLITASYIILHQCIKGSQNEKLSKEDIIKITEIISKYENDMKNDTDLIKLENDPLVNNDKIESTKKSYLNLTLDKIIDYVNVKFSHKLSQTERLNIVLRDKTFPELKEVLPVLAVSVESYFWFNDPLKFLEVIFWTWFGVLCSILYYCSENIRTGNFKIQEVSVYWAKLFYAPFVSVAIVFVYKSFTTTSPTFDDTSVGLLFFSFILGFFSGRAIELLNRLKDAIIPGENTVKPDKIFTIVGVVKYNNETPVKGVIVTLSSENGFNPTTARTDDKGNYAFKSQKLINGNYNLSSKDSTTSREVIIKVDSKTEEEIKQDIILPVTFTVIGKVILSNGNAVRQDTEVVLSLENNVVASAKTDDKGNYEFKNQTFVKNNYKLSSKATNDNNKEESGVVEIKQELKNGDEIKVDIKLT